MNTLDFNPGQITIPDTDEARSVADRFAHFLVYGAARATDTSIPTTVTEGDGQSCVGQSTTSSSTLPAICNQVGFGPQRSEPDGQVGVVCEPAAAEPSGDNMPAEASVEPPTANSATADDDQLRMTY
jgi:hypothetical protein